MRDTSMLAELLTECTGWLAEHVPTDHTPPPGSDNPDTWMGVCLDAVMGKKEALTVPQLARLTTAVEEIVELAEACTEEIARAEPMGPKGAAHLTSAMNYKRYGDTTAGIESLHELVSFWLTNVRGGVMDTLHDLYLASYDPAEEEEN